MLRIGVISQGRLVQPITDGLIANGCEVQHRSGSDTWDLRDCDYLLFHGPAYPIGKMIHQLKDLSDYPPLIAWYSEQIPNPYTPLWLVSLLSRIRFAMESWYDDHLLPWWDARRSKKAILPGLGRWRRVGEIVYLHSVGRLKLICTFSHTQTRFFKRLGLPAVEIPFGHNPHFGRLLNLPRDLDVVFLGSSNDFRRKRWLPTIEKKLAKSSIKLIIKDGSLARGSCYDEERTHLLNRTKILLNVMKKPWDDPIYRLLLASANGTLLLSEPIWATSRGRFLPDEHFVQCELDQISEKIEYYLRNDSARDPIVQNVSREISEHMTMDRMVADLLQRLAA
jgi:hypothetical protein